MNNILHVKIPKELSERVETGIEWIDKVFSVEGGLVPSLVYLLVGTPGAGKSTMTRQIGDALTGNDVIVQYNSGEESKEQIALGCRRMGLKNGFGHSSETCHIKLLARLEKISAEFPDKKIVLIQDSIQKLNASAPFVDAFKALQAWAKKTLNIVVVISQVTKGGDFKGNNDIQHDADCRIDMTYSKKTGRRRMVPIKNRFGIVDPVGYGYELVKTGLIMVEDDEDDESLGTGRRNYAPYEVKKGDKVRTTASAPPKHQGHVATVHNVGRTRLEAFAEDGTKLYLPFDCFEVVNEDNEEKSNVVPFRAAAN